MVKDDAFSIAVLKIVGLLRENDRFLIMTHEDPDLDGLGSMFALAMCLRDFGKEAVTLVQKQIPPSLAFLSGAERAILRDRGVGGEFDAVLVLDCAEKERLGSFADLWPDVGITINIDHHETNSRFGRYNLVDTGSSSTAELVYRLITAGDFPLGLGAAGNLFAAIQSDTGSFKFTNTTPGAMRISADLMDRGVDPWDTYLRSMNGYSPERLKLLAKALDSIRFYSKGRIGMMVITKEMIKESGARPSDMEGFVEYPRYVGGVEVSVLIREKDDNTYKFSIRSNRRVNVAQLASRFQGGGHGKAAGFTARGSFGTLKRDFLSQTDRILNETPL